MEAPGNKEDERFTIIDEHKSEYYDAESARAPMPDEPPPPYPPCPPEPEDTNHSLPTPEDAINMAAFKEHVGAFNGLPYKQKRFICIVIASILGIAVIAGFSAGIAVTKQNQASTMAALTQSSSDGPVATNSASLERLEEVKDFLSAFSTHSSLNTMGSPQYLAAQWIAVDDQIQMDIPTSTPFDQSFQFVQRYIMAVFYYSLDGGSWDLPQAKFLSASSVCDWNFKLNAPVAVPGGDKTMWHMGVMCNDKGEVNQIFLPHNHLTGQLPTELNILPTMEHFSVYGNSISGPLPDLSNWQKLTFLVLENNDLSGSLGSWFQFPKLEYLGLGSNSFTGPLPSFDWATSLLQVALNDNDFTGSVDVFNNVPSLQSLFLQKNAFTGPLTDDTFADLKLKDLDMSDNKLTGSMPEKFYHFHVVDLHNNSLSGNLPDVEKAGYPLDFLSLNNNQIEGGIPDSFGFLYNLMHLDLSFNKLSGRMVGDLGQLTKLEYLFLQHNNFDAGKIVDLNRLYKLKELSLQATNRVGPIPSWIGYDLKKLVLLDLHGNALTGTIPSNFESLTDLRFLFLNDNKINGTIPDTLSSLSNLAMFTMQRNDLTGDATNMCGAYHPPELVYFVGDCKGDESFTCDCCSTCCTDSDTNCGRLEMSGNFDHGYNRTQYVFSEDLKFSVSSTAPTD